MMIENYKIIVEMKINHDFFILRECPDVELIPTDETSWTFFRLQMVFKQTAASRWLILASDNTNYNTPWEETLEFRIRIKNPSFWHYTSTPIKECNNNLQLENIRVEMSNNALLKGLSGEPIKKEISFYSPKVYWKYIFIPNVENAHPKKIKFVDQSPLQLQFNQMDDMTIGERTGQVFISKEAIQLKEHYEYQFGLFEEKIYGEKILRKEIAFPEIHAFDTATKNNKIRTLYQYIYY